MDGGSDLIAAPILCRTYGAVDARTAGDIGKVVIALVFSMLAKP